MVISGTVRRPLRRRTENDFSSSETSKNVHIVNGKPAVSPVARIHFSGPEKTEKIVISGTEGAGCFAGSEKTVSQDPKRQKMFISQTGTRTFRRWQGKYFQVPKSRKMDISLMVRRPFRR